MATTLDLRAQDGSSAGTVTLDDAIFGIEPNMAVLRRDEAEAQIQKHEQRSRAAERSPTDKRAPAELVKDRFEPPSSPVAELCTDPNRVAIAKK